MFNGSGISSRERIDSEKNYLRAVLRDVDKVKKEDSTENAASASASAGCTVTSSSSPAEAKEVEVSSAEVISDMSASSTLPVSTVSTQELPLSSGLSTLLAMHPRFDVLNKQYGADLIPMVSERGGGVCGVCGVWVFGVFGCLGCLGVGGVVD